MGNTCRQPATLPRSHPTRRAAVHKGLHFPSPRSYIFIYFPQPHPALIGWAGAAPQAGHPPPMARRGEKMVKKI